MSKLNKKEKKMVEAKNRLDPSERERLNEEILSRGVVEIITEEGLRSRLESGEPLRVKYGIDPTMRSGHIGHAAPLRKLSQFQDLGHTAVIIIGDWTATIGDPTGRTTARAALSVDEVQNNAKLYFDQVYKILDPQKTEVHLQSEWYDDFKLRDLIALMSKVTHSQLMGHETFAVRVREGNPLSFHEMLYPVLQAYDSVAVKADVELGGADQRFNFVLTRDLQKLFGQRPEEVILSRYLPGTDGQEKMSKSLGNTVDLLDSADEMYGKVMSIPDVHVPVFFELATDLPMGQVKALLDQVQAGTLHPMDLKKSLARNITSLYHNPEETEHAQASFEGQIQRREIPEEIPQAIINSHEVNLVDLLTSNGITNSKAEARRLMQQNGIRIGDTVIENPEIIVDSEVIVRVGRRKFLRITSKID